MSHRPAHRPKSRVPFMPVAVALGALVVVLIVWKTLPSDRSSAGPPATPGRGGTSGVVQSSPAPLPSRRPQTFPQPVSGPIDPEFNAFTTLRGNWSRSFQGEGPVPLHPVVAWKAGPWCGRSVDLGEAKTWCGTGWNGTPNVIPQKSGGVEIRVGGYDWNYHFLDGETGKPTRAEFQTGDLAKGSATSDPEGYPLYYIGSRDNRFRIVATDRKKPVELWSMDANSSVPDPRWNDDWDGSAQIVGDYLLEGGENSWFYVVKLNRDYDKSGKVTVNPRIVFTTPGWDEQQLGDLRSVGQSSLDIGIEDSVAYDSSRKVVYFGSSGGLVQGFDLSKILRGGSQADRVFRYWTAGENDASIVLDDQGMLYVSEHYMPPNSRAQQVGQLVKLDPAKKNPLVWKVKETRIADDGEAGFFSTPALVGKTIFASANGGDLMAIDAETGKVFWRYRLQEPLWSGPVVVDGKLVIGDCSGRLYGFDVSHPRKKPRKLWDLYLGGCIESTPAVWDGIIYVGTRAGFEYGIKDKHPAQLQHRWKREQAVGLVPSPSPSASVSASATGAAPSASPPASP